MMRRHGSEEVSTSELFEALQPTASPEQRARIERQLEESSPGVARPRVEVERLERVLAAWRAIEAPDATAEHDDALVGRALAEAAWLPRRRGPLYAAMSIVAVGSVAAWLLLVFAPARQARTAAVAATIEAGPSWGALALSEGTDLVAGEGQALSLRLGQAMRITLQPEARISLEHSRLRLKQVLVRSGAALVAVHGRSRDEAVRVRTPHGIVRVTGTVFSVTVGEHSTRVAVLEGHTLFVTPDGRRQAIAAGSMLTATKAGLALELMDAAAYALFRRVPRSGQLARGAAVATSSGEPAAATSAAPPLAAQASAMPTAAPSSRAATRAAAAPAVRPRTGVPSDRADAEASGSALAGGEGRGAPDPVLLDYQRAERAIARGDAASAVRLLEGVTLADSRHPLAQTALYELARVHEQMLSDPQAALAAYRQYLQLGPTTPLFIEARQAVRRITALLARPVPR